MNDKNNLDLAVKLFKQKQEQLKAIEENKRKWAAASLCSTQNGNPLYRKSIKF